MRSLVLGRTESLALAILVITIVIIFSSPQAYSQTDTFYSETQTMLSEDLENDPLAQDIIAKIEKTKEWIAEFKEQESKQKEIEEKREEALASLQKDLEAWKKLWEEFTFDYKFERQSGIFWDQHNFTKSKIMVGREALEQILAEGGGPEEARSAYVNAAKIKRSELIMVNSLINVKYGMAYYNQQILFDSDGQFHDVVSGDKLRMYYDDFRTNPSYLDSNSNDEISWIEMSVGILDECRNGYVLVHRFQTDDYVCVTEQTSEMWVRHDMGKPLSDELILSGNDQLSIEKFKEDSITEKIQNINNKINTTYMYYDEKMKELEKKYEYALIDLKIEQTNEEKKILKDFDDEIISKEIMIQRIENMREKYDSFEKHVIHEKDQAFMIMDSNHKQHMKEFIGNFESMSNVQIVWNSDQANYEALKK